MVTKRNLVSRGQVFFLSKLILTWRFCLSFKKRGGRSAKLADQPGDIKRTRQLLPGTGNIFLNSSYSSWRSKKDSLSKIRWLFVWDHTPNATKSFQCTKPVLKCIMILWDRDEIHDHAFLTCPRGVNHIAVWCFGAGAMIFALLLLALSFWE